MFAMGLGLGAKLPNSKLNKVFGNREKADYRSSAYSAAHFAMELDQEAIGLIRSIEGGGVKADVMRYEVGSSHKQFYQLGKPKFEDFKVMVGMALSDLFYDWIECFFVGDHLRKDGAILAADFNYKERARRTFYQAIIKEVTFPALSAADKQPAYLGVTLAPEYMEFEQSYGRRLLPVEDTDKQKLWSSCNFRFTVDGFGDITRRVTKVDSFSIKQQVNDHHVGGYRYPIRVGTRVEFPRISFSLPEKDASAFYWHFEKHGIKGTGRDGHGLTGAIEYLDPKKRTLGILRYEGAEIVGLTPDRSDGSANNFKMVKVEMTTEGMVFDHEAASKRKPKPRKPEKPGKMGIPNSAGKDSPSATNTRMSDMDDIG